MKIKDLFSDVENGGVFNVFWDECTDDFCYLFPDVGIKTLNSMLLLTYGNKILTDLITKENYKLIIKSVIAVNLERWKRLKDVLNTKYNVLAPVESTETHETTADRQQDSDNTRFEAQKSFNDEDFTDNERSKGNDTQTTKEQTTTTIKKQSGVSSRPVADVLQSELKLREKNLHLQIIGEIVYDITIDIY